jgi:hypothetical protein
MAHLWNIGAPTWASMRWIVFGAILCAVPTGRDAKAEVVETAKKVKEIYDNTQKLLDWSEWTEDTALRMLDDKPKPARHAPGAINGDKFEKLLNDANDKVEALTLPALSYFSPDLTNLGILSRDEMRAKLRDASSGFQVPLGELAKNRSARSDLDRILKQVAAQNDALRRTADLAPEIVQKFPTEVIYNELILQFGSISLSFIPLNEKLQETIKLKQKEFDTEIKTETDELRGSGNYIINQLSAEQDLLNNDVAQLKATAEKIDQEHQAVVLKQQAAERLNKDVQRLNAYVQAAQLDVQQASERQSELMSTVNNLTSAVTAAE